MLPRDLKLVCLPAERTLEFADPLLQLAFTLALVLARERDLAALKQLLPPRLVERLRDLMLTTQILHRHLTAKAREDDLQFLLNRKSPALPLLAELESPFS